MGGCVSRPRMQAVMSPEISILLPVHNGARFLDVQLCSLLQQSTRDLEVLAHDDGSTDSSRAILAKRAAEDDRLIVTGSTVNLGQNAALARLLGDARGRFIAFSDQDDLWHPEKLARLRAAIGDAGLAYGMSLLVDAEGRETGRSVFDVLSARLEGRNEAQLLIRNSVSGHAMLVRRELVTPIVFTASRPYDWLIAGVATFSSGIRFVPDAITYHRIHGGNLVNDWMLAGKRSRVKRQRGWRHGLLLLLDSLRVLATHEAVPEEKRVVFKQMTDLVRAELGYVVPAIERFTFIRRFMRLVEQLEVPEASREGVLRRLRWLRPPVSGTAELLSLGRWR